MVVSYISPKLHCTRKALTTPVDSVGQELDRMHGVNLSFFHDVWVLSRKTWGWWPESPESSLTHMLGVGAGCRLVASVPPHICMSRGPSTDFLRSWWQGSKAATLKERTPGKSHITFCGLPLQESQHYFHPNLLIRSKSPKPVHIQEEGKQTPPLIGRNAKALGGWGMGLKILLWPFLENKIFIYIYYI